MAAGKLRVVVLKPSKYGTHGYVERFRRGFMSNGTVPYIRSMTPPALDGIPIETHGIDEYVRTDLDYLRLLHATDHPTLLALVGVQSHQFHRSLDLAAYALANGVRHCIIGGPHPMTCDTSMLQGKGVSFAVGEAEMSWTEILRDAIRGELAPVYGTEQRWQGVLDAPVLQPPSRADLNRYLVPMLGLYPARGCPFTCNFCSVIKIAGHRIRSQEIDTTMASLHAAKSAGVKLIMFTSDNFNKYDDAEALLLRMIEERVRLPFFVQCDAQVAKQEAFIKLLARAGCFQMFVGVESFNRKTLLAAHKAQNHPDLYEEIVRLCRVNKISTHFSNIIGFPDDTRESIRNHTARLVQVRPDCASFYILTPIPGTQQYDEFLAAGMITEPNLDRYDASCATFRHPVLQAAELYSLLKDCYRQFYSPRQIGLTILDGLRPRKISPGLVSYAALPIFNRYSIWKGVHPMSGGVGNVYRDHVSAYIQRRIDRYGYELVPLPASLELSETDARLNRMGMAASS